MYRLRRTGLIDDLKADFVPWEATQYLTVKKLNVAPDAGAAFIRFRGDSDTNAFVISSNNNEVSFAEVNPSTGAFIDIPIWFSVAAPNNSLFVDSNGEVNLTGQGNDKLHLSSASPRILFEDGSSGDWYLQVVDDNRWRFQTPSANEALTIAKDGSVGIGTDSPGVELDVDGEIRAQAQSTGGNSFSGRNSSGVETFKIDHNVDHAFLALSDDNGVNLVQLRTDTADSYVTAGGGNFGIGTSSPSFKLDVEAGTQFEAVRIGRNDAGPLLRFHHAGNRNWDFRIDTTGLYLYDSSGGDITMYWNENGNVGIGTGSPGHALDGQHCR